MGVPRTTIELTEEQRAFLDSLPHGQIKLVLSELINCAMDLAKKYGNQKAASFIQAGIMELTDKHNGG